MQLPNPPGGKFERVQGEYGYREVHGDEEIVHIPTGRSNMQYWKPEMVMNPEGCSHTFFITSIGKREIECNHCHYATSFHVNDFSEREGKGYIKVNDTEYQISSL